jgi:transcriptional regulator CtsR
MEARSLVNEIEAYLKSLLNKSPEGWVELSRKDIAELFGCVPSQITYVINTRFALRNGYVVQSRRGGGGFIRICSLFKAPEGALNEQFAENEEEDEDEKDLAEEAREALYTLARQGFFTRREFIILGTALEVLERNFPDGKGGELLLEILRALSHEDDFF